MKCEAHNISVKPSTQDTQTRASFSGLNYRGPSQNLKSLQTDSPQRSGRAMIDLLATDICLEDVFGESKRRTVQAHALAASRIG